MVRLAIAHRGSALVVSLLYESLDAARAAMKAADGKFEVIRFGPDALGQVCWVRRECLASISTLILEPPASVQPQKPLIVKPDLVLPTPGNGG